MRITPITDRQREVLAYIAEHIDLHGYGPSVGKIAGRFRIVYGAAKNHVLALEDKGYIVRDDTKNRAISLVGVRHAGQEQEDSGKRKA